MLKALGENQNVEVSSQVNVPSALQIPIPWCLLAARNGQSNWCFSGNSCGQAGHSVTRMILAEIENYSRSKWLSVPNVKHPILIEAQVAQAYKTQGNAQ